MYCVCVCVQVTCVCVCVHAYVYAPMNAYVNVASTVHVQSCGRSERQVT